ncbi:formate dehydrogenase subunit gamma [Roseibacterium sp. SDUM158016]|uniref:formate dehydrogenase subunit gamma n=1 Tax=Roseicyclus sediminis TaxID=2980997 RepID=UPI0021CFCAD5|nr:formate dehydrogenase subunit gamma [Roseibacterium sp. SDUM158016]MCU4651714.1 formate dehydrogenase subunit gamma [Roseibacterium sp. SDUM158016]
MSASHASPPVPQDEIRAIVARHLHLEGPLLPILHALQAEYGHVPAAAHGPICDALNITRAELHGVVTFYHDFREAPAGRHVVKICRSEACQAVGGDALSARVLDLLGLSWGDTSADGRVTVEPVYCLGLCACGPAAMVNGAVRGRVTAEALVAEVAS